LRARQVRDGVEALAEHLGEVALLVAGEPELHRGAAGGAGGTGQQQRPRVGERVDAHALGEHLGHRVVGERRGTRDRHEQVRVVAGHAGAQPPELGVGGGAGRAGQVHLAQRLQRGLGRRPGTDRLEVLRQRVRVERAECVLLGGEVVEERARRDVGGGRDLVDRDVVHAPLGHQPQRGVLQRAAGGALLALAQPRLGRRRYLCHGSHATACSATLQRLQESGTIDRLHTERTPCHMTSTTTARPDGAGRPGSNGTTPAPFHLDAGSRAVFIGLMIGMFVAAISQTIVSPALPIIVAELGGMEHYSWLATSAMLASAVVVPVVGKLSDLYGRRPFYIAGLVLFLIGAVLSGLAQRFWWLVGARVIQGIGMGSVMPLSQVSIGDITPPRQRGKYQGLMGAVFGICSIAGPLAGGFITDHWGWRWLFFVGIPFGLVGLVFIAKNLHLPHTPRKAVVDVWGIVTLTVALVAILLATSWGGTTYPWSDWHVIGL